MTLKIHVHNYSQLHNDARFKDIQKYCVCLVPGADVNIYLWVNKIAKGKGQ